MMKKIQVVLCPHFNSKCIVKGDSFLSIGNAKLVLFSECQTCIEYRGNFSGSFNYVRCSHSYPIRKRRILNVFQCENCGKAYKYPSFAEKCEHSYFAEGQIEKNEKLIMLLHECKDKVSRKRYRYALYRLSQLGIPIQNEHERRLVGVTFKELCEKSHCILEPYFTAEGLS
jgi:hypothetical protein